MLEICLLSADRLCGGDNFDENSIIDALPFGKVQSDRLLGIRNDGARALSLTAWYIDIVVISCNNDFVDCCAKVINHKS